MITLHLTQQEADALLAIAEKISNSQLPKGGERRDLRDAYESAHRNDDAFAVAGKLKALGLYSPSTMQGDIATGVERRRKQQLKNAATTHHRAEYNRPWLELKDRILSRWPSVIACCRELGFYYVDLIVAVNRPDLRPAVIAILQREGLLK